MFRNLTVYAVMLGILICPLYCGEGKESSSSASQVAQSGSCCGCGQPTDESQKSPAPCSDGCIGDCVCKGLLIERAKILDTCTDLWLPVFTADNDGLKSIVRSSRQFSSERTVHPHLNSGRAILIAFDTLLI